MESHHCFFILFLSSTPNGPQSQVPVSPPYISLPGKIKPRLLQRATICCIFSSMCLLYQKEDQNCLALSFLSKIFSISLCLFKSRLASFLKNPRSLRSIISNLAIALLEFSSFSTFSSV